MEEPISDWQCNSSAGYDRAGEVSMILDASAPSTA